MFTIVDKIFFALVGLLVAVFATAAIAFPLQTATGVQDVSSVITEGIKPTYRAQVTNITPAATATDVVTLCGSATRTIRITRWQITINAGSQSYLDIYIYKRSTPNTGGTSTALVPVALDSNDAAATATGVLYSANPTSVGTGVVLVSDHYGLSGTGGAAAPWIEDFGVRNSRAVVLRGVNQCVTLSFNGQTIPNQTSVHAGIEWTEE